MSDAWNPTVENMSRDGLRFVQLERLKTTVEMVYANVPYYRAKMQNIGMLPGDVKSLEDLRAMPFTTKDDLRQAYPFGMFASPLEKIVRIHASAGTTGRRTVVGYTKKDADVWAECMARCLTMAGVNKRSVVQVCLPYGLYTSGLGAQYGAERVGATVVPASVGSSPQQIRMMMDFGVDVLCATPSYALYLAEAMTEAGLSKSDLRLETGIFGEEPWSVNTRDELEERLGLRAYDIYGSSELLGLGISQECEFQDGLHIWEDYFISEVVDPDTGKTLPPKTNGEMVFTTICKEGFPLIRYRTGDIASLSFDACGCGRTHVRMCKPSARKDDAFVVRGVTVYPSQIENMLRSMDETSLHYQIELGEGATGDEMTVKIEVDESMFSDQVRILKSLENGIQKQIESGLGLAAKIRLVEPKSLQRVDGKVRRVIDKRKK